MRHALIEPADSLLVVIDVQDHFLAQLAAAARDALVARVGWLVALADWLGIPLVVTAESMASLGGTTATVAALLPAGTTTHDKPIFGLVATPAILGAVAATGRRTAILVGLETDVCVAQSGLGLLAEGYRVVVVADATGSPGPAHDAGIVRLHDAGATVVGAKGLYCEWLRSVERAERFRAERGGALGVPNDW